MLEPVIIQNGKIRLEPLTVAHASALSELVKDGNLWELNVTSAPEPENSLAYIEKALNQSDSPCRLG